MFLPENATAILTKKGKQLRNCQPYTKSKGLGFAHSSFSLKRAS